MLSEIKDRKVYKAYLKRVPPNQVVNPN